MNIKIGYYPILDAVLLIRQIYSVERFKPFTSIVEAIDSKLSQEKKEAINKAAYGTKEWLEVIRNLIDLTMQGVTSPEEIFIRAFRDPTCLFGAQAEENMVSLLSDIWYNYCSGEVARNINHVRMKATDISKIPSGPELIDYMLGQSDRIEKIGNSLKFNIKPDLSVKMDDIENIIVMPSVFSCRNLSFWYSGNTFLFYIAADSKPMSFEEPSDMLMLRALAFNDKTRLKMLKLLASSALSVNDLAEKLAVNASTISRHFKVFKDAAFVDIQSQQGNSVYYSINESEVKKAMETIYDYIFRRE